MNRPYDDEDDGPPGRGYPRDPDRSGPGRGADREILLGAPAILGIFFALALDLRRLLRLRLHHGPQVRPGRHTPIPQPPTPTPPATARQARRRKPGQPARSAAAQPATDSAATTAVVQTEPASGHPPRSPFASKNAATAADGMIVGDKPSTSVAQPTTNNLQPATSPTGTIMVQIAAVSSQDVADILLASLQKKGYSVSVRHEPQDKLLHVQIGPFATRKDAEAMQQRVLADGFNAIVK